MIYTILNLAHDFFVGPGNCVLAIPPLLLAALIGAGSGFLNNREKQRQADIERQYQAETARWSPWTGLSSHSVQNPSKMGDVMGGALAGASFGSQFGGIKTAAPQTKSTYLSLLGGNTGEAGDPSGLSQYNYSPVGEVPGYEKGWMGEDSWSAKDKKGNKYFVR